jgi:hypothetical protein
MVDRRLHRGLWWARIRLRWRRRLRSLDGTHALDAAVTGGLAVAGVLTATSHAPDSTKVSIVILLGVAELVFFFGRVIRGELRKLAARSLNVLPDGLPVTIFHHLYGERESLLSRAQELADNKSCDLEKHEMYATLIHLTDTVTTRFSGTLSAAIYAVSGTDIEDFEREMLAKEYLDANRRAAVGLVVVRRLFLLDANQLRSPRIREIMKKHEGALSTVGAADSGVKWLPKSNAGSDRDLDFAVFANEALVRQVYRPGGAKGELTVNDGQITPALEAFERLWEHPRARSVADYDATRR